MSQIALKYFVSLLLLIGLAACASSTSPNSYLMRSPGAGSWFKYREDTIDTTTGQVVRTEYGTDSVVATGLHYADKSNVSAIAKDGHSDINYVCYELNGDISIRDSVSFEPDSDGVWNTLPLASKGTHSYP